MTKKNEFFFEFVPYSATIFVPYSGTLFVPYNRPPYTSLITGLNPKKCVACIKCMKAKSSSHSSPLISFATLLATYLPIWIAWVHRRIFNQILIRPLVTVLIMTVKRVKFNRHNQPNSARNQKNGKKKRAYKPTRYSPLRQLSQNEEGTTIHSDFNQFYTAAIRHTYSVGFWGQRIKICKPR